MDVGEHTTLRDCHSAQQFIQFLVVSHSKLDVTWYNARLLVVASGISSELKDFSSEVLQDGGEVDRGTSTNSRGIAALFEETTNTSNGKLKTRLRTTGGGLLGSRRPSS